MGKGVQKTYCRICEAACGLRAEYGEDGDLERLLPDAEHPLSRGYICAKGTRFGEVAADSDRLMYPMLRRDNGTYQRISWKRAFRVFGERVRPILERYGPDSVGFYFGNPLAFNAFGSGAMLGVMAGLGSQNMFVAASQDCNNKFTASQIVHGSPWVHPIPDFENADTAILLGTNPAVSQSSFVHLEGGIKVFDRLVERGGEIFWVDPRQTESVKRWGEHLQLVPGTDIYLLLSLLDGMKDRYVESELVEGMEDLLACAAQYPLERAAALTGVPLDLLRHLLGKLRASKRIALHMSVGVNHGPFGTFCYVVMQALSYLCGALDQEGGSLFHPLASVATKLTKFLGVGNSERKSRIGGFPNLLDSMPGGILADEILTPGEGQLRALIVVAGNPLRSIPGEQKLREAFASLEFLVGVDMFQNQSLQSADLLLPTTSWLERWDFATTTALFQKASLLQYAGPVNKPPGEVRTENEILSTLCAEMNRSMFGSWFLSSLWRMLPSDRWVLILF